MIKRAAVFVLSAALTCTFIIDLCAIVFSCGCHSFWNGAAEACNIHAAHGHHCPWCSLGTEAFAGIVLAIVSVQAALSFGSHRWGIGARLLSSLIAFPVVGSAIGLYFGWTQGYWK